MSTESENGVAKRLDELEARLTFQDDLLDQLNAVVAHQDALLRQYEQRLSTLDSRVRQVSEQVAPEIDNAPPPHY
ncbi:MAG: SlyX family protein [Natronospirillum sp.]|uniref:SlyX family protein n=1 Tax=Natronospirillum sp. TaxID=2812955 RepID=UPI0025EB2896|nr:SlyX family protein [Natronospirillum sp.]MCH8551077.1 SlyX family protein [Natronospirillum sp.]